VAALLVAPALVDAEVVGARFRSSTWGVELLVPRDWELSEQPSYPRILVRGIEHKGSGRVTLAAQPLAAGDTVRAVAERSAAGLKKSRYAVGAITTHASGAVLLEAQTPDK